MGGGGKGKNKGKKRFPAKEMNKGTDNKAIYFQSVFPAVSIIIP
jgi:hypothetical protein